MRFIDYDQEQTCPLIQAFISAATHDSARHFARADRAKGQFNRLLRGKH